MDQWPESDIGPPMPAQSIAWDLRHTARGITPLPQSPQTRQAVPMETPAQRSDATRDSDIALLAGPAMTLGSTMLLVALLGLPLLPGWADDYGPLVYFAVFLFLSLAARLLWWGIIVRRRSL